MKVPHFVWFGLAVIIACSASASLAANGDNLVANGTFDTDTSSWTGPDNSPAEWTADDADGAPDSGSVAVGTQTSPSNNGSPVRSTCIPVVGGRDYVFAASRKWVARSSFGSVDTFVTLFWYEACGGAKLTDERIVGATDHWTATQLFVTAPPHAGYAKVYLAVSRDIDNLRSGGTAAFDNILLASVVCGDSCGDPVADASAHSALVTSSDALYILKSAIGEEACPGCICDVNASGDVSATDALLTLAATAGEPVSLTCPQ